MNMRKRKINKQGGWILILISKNQEVSQLDSKDRVRPWTVTQSMGILGINQQLKGIEEGVKLIDWQNYQ